MKRSISRFSLKLKQKKWVKNHEYRHAYEELKTEFELARTLIDARVATGLTQAQVAQRMKTSQAAIAVRMEGGKVKPSAGYHWKDTLKRLANAYEFRLNR